MVVHTIKLTNFDSIKDFDDDSVFERDPEYNYLKYRNLEYFLKHPEEYLMRDLTNYLKLRPEHNNIICVGYSVGYYADRILDKQADYGYSVCYVKDEGVNVQNAELYAAIKNKIPQSCSGLVVYEETKALNILNSFRLLEGGGYFCSGLGLCTINFAGFIELTQPGTFMLYLLLDTESG